MPFEPEMMWQKYRSGVIDFHSYTSATSFQVQKALCVSLSTYMILIYKIIMLSNSLPIPIYYAKGEQLVPEGSYTRLSVIYFYIFLHAINKKTSTH